MTVFSKFGYGSDSAASIRDGKENLAAAIERENVVEIETATFSNAFNLEEPFRINILDVGNELV